MVNLSSNLLYIAFVLYSGWSQFSSFGGAIKDKRWSQSNHTLNNWSKIGITVTIIGFVAQLGYFIICWIAAGHVPVKNLFEFTQFSGDGTCGCFYRPILYLICIITSACGYIYLLLFSLLLMQVCFL